MLPLDRMKGLDKDDRLSIRGFGRDADASIPGLDQVGPQKGDVHQV